MLTHATVNLRPDLKVKQTDGRVAVRSRQRRVCGSKADEGQDLARSNTSAVARWSCGYVVTDGPGSRAISPGLTDPS